MESGRFRWLSYFLIGTPFYSFVWLFLPKSTESFYSASLFMIFLLFEICRFLIMTLVIPKLFLKNYIQTDGHMRTDLLYYPLVVFSILIAISHFVVVISLSKGITTNYAALESIQDLVWTVLIFCVLIGASQLFISAFVTRSFITRRKQTRQSKHNSLIFVLLIASILAIWIVWTYILAYATTYEPAVLRAGIPIVSLGIICITLGIGSMVITLEIIKPNLRRASKASITE